MTKGWTPERRAAQREHCLRVKPWRTTRGPITPAGKAISSQNALKTGLHSSLPIIRDCARERLWREQSEQLTPRLVAFIKAGREIPEVIQDAADLLHQGKPEDMVICPKCLCPDPKNRGVYYLCQCCGHRFGV